MLRVGPWNRLPLTIRWLSEEHARDLSLPPMHMPICYGAVVSKKLKKSEECVQVSECGICCQTVSGKAMRCLNAGCDLKSHVVCLAERFAERGEYVPVEGKCPKCGKVFLWGDLVRKYKGCYGSLEVTINNVDDYFEFDSD